MSTGGSGRNVGSVGGARSVSMGGGVVCVLSAVDPLFAFIVDRSVNANNAAGNRSVCTIAIEVTAENVRGRKFVFMGEKGVCTRTARAHICVFTIEDAVSVKTASAHSFACMDD